MERDFAPYYAALAADAAFDQELQRAYGKAQAWRRARQARARACGGQVSMSTPTPDALRECCKPRLIRFGRFGLAENPKHAIVVHGNALYHVLDYYRRESPAYIMLRVRHLNGEDAGEVAASAVKILPDHFHAEDSDEDEG